LEPPRVILDGWPPVYDDPKWAEVREETAEGTGYTPAPALEFRIGVLRLDRVAEEDVFLLSAFSLELSGPAFAFQVAIAIIIASPQASQQK